MVARRPYSRGMLRHDDISASAKALLGQVDELIASVSRDAQAEMATWPKASKEFEASALNLAAYLALRRHDLRPLQQSLMVLGLSSLGRLESRVLEMLSAVRASLAAVAKAVAEERPSPAEFFAGHDRLRSRTLALFGQPHPTRRVAVMVTCPSGAADDPDFFPSLAQRGVDSIRINCAHDDRDAWGRMIERARAAGRASGRPFRVFMDLAGPKIRTGKTSVRAGQRLRRGDRLAIAFAGSLKDAKRDFGQPAVECTLESALQAAEPGQRIFYDDGKMGLVVERTTPWGLLAKVQTCVDKGVKVKAEKGLNFPDTDFATDALTAKDLEDLDFVATHADGVEYSFVQCADDVIQLQNALAQRREDWRSIALVLKIETSKAVSKLPEIIVQAASSQPTAVMIARGDLAVEIGFNRMAEMQEELLWLAEAAHIPSIWATQVLEHLVSKGTPLRGEMTDAAMSGRAECVMLNKGPFLLEGIDALETLLERMADHQDKKTPELRALHTWPMPDGLKAQ